MMLPTPRLRGSRTLAAASRSAAWVTPGLGVSVSAPGATAIGGADFQDNGASAAGPNLVGARRAGGGNLIVGEVLERLRRQWAALRSHVVDLPADEVVEGRPGAAIGSDDVFHAELGRQERTGR